VIQLLVERAREVGLGLVVLHDPFHRAAEQAVLLVQLLDEDFADHLVHERRGRERPGQRERAADADRRARRRGRRGLQGQAERKQRAGRDQCESLRIVHVLSSSIDYVSSA